MAAYIPLPVHNHYTVFMDNETHNHESMHSKVSGEYYNVYTCSKSET